MMSRPEPYTAPYAQQHYHLPMDRDYDPYNSGFQLGQNFGLDDEFEE